MHTGLLPNYLSSLVPPPFSSVSRYNLRNSNTLRPVQSRTSVYYNSFLPAVTSEWKDLSDEVKNSPSLNRFKYNLKQRTNRKVPSYFYAGTRQLQIYHAILIMKCSSSNNYLYMRNIVNSPLCRCGNIETNSHFIFKWPFYTDARLSLKTAIESLNATFDESTILYGNELLSNEGNTSIVLHFQTYIHKTKLF